MAIRNELNNELFKQKEYGLERPTHYVDYEILYVITRGDTKKLAFLLENKSMTSNRVLSKNRLQNIKYLFAITTAITAINCTEAGLGSDEAYIIADIYNRKADALHTESDVEKLFTEMYMEYGKRMQEIRKEKITSIHIRKCISHIYQDLSGDLSVKGLAKFTGLNETYFAKLFKHETGLTVKDYVTAAKMDTAKNLLKYSELTCSEIAASLGYSSQSAFIFAFRCFTGLTPKKYRESE